MHEKLNHPIWFALSETHRDYAIEYDEFKFYHPDYGPFGSLPKVNTNTEALVAYSELIEAFYVVGERPQLPDHLDLKKELVCNLMILEQPIELVVKTNIIPLTEQHQGELTDLINLVQPGYFRSKTFEMGNYFGIFQEGQLVSVTGERMRMEGYTEVSAVVTHPDYTGRGYARQLVKHTVDGIFDSNQVPFLHVASANTLAIRLYEKLGFRTRQQMSFWHVVRNEE